MPTIENQTLSKLYYSIGEVAELLQVNASLLRFWEKEFNLSVSKKNKKGNRLYTAKEIEKIQRIYHFVKVEGYTLEGAKKALKSKVEPNFAIPSEDMDAPLVENTALPKNTSALDAAALISKLEDIKKRLLSLHFEEVPHTTIASAIPSTYLQKSKTRLIKPQLLRTLSLANQKVRPNPSQALTLLPFLIFKFLLKIRSCLQHPSTIPRAHFTIDEFNF